MIKKKILQIINNKLFNYYNHGIFPTVEFSKLINFINKIKAHDLGYDLIRIGPNGDGGYLIPDILKQIDTCFSPGIGNIHGFEMDLLRKGKRVYMADKTVEKPILEFENYNFIKKNIGSYNDDETITLDNWIKETQINENLLLQMDIEGSEYDVINRLEERNLNKFKIMIIEFHNFEQVTTKIGFKLINNVFNKILEYFDVSHIHPNNCCGYYNINNTVIPSTLEITFLRKDLTLQKKKILEYPNKLDFINVEKNNDIILDKTWY